MIKLQRVAFGCIRMADKTAKFTFQHLEGKKFNSIECKETQEQFLKWSMKDRIKAQAFSFDQQFQSYMKKDFVLAFMQDPNVIFHLQTLSSSDKWSSLGMKAESVTAEEVPCTTVSMTLFDKLYDNGIVKESGHISKCFDDFYEDITISDELRRLFLIEDSDNYDIYTEDERNEFLFRLIKHVCLGGSVCQYEDEIQPYQDLTKLIYKDLVSVQKDSSTGDLHVTSTVFKITASDTQNESGTFYPADKEHPQNFAYLIVDPLRRHVNVLYHRFGSSTFS